MSRGIIGTLTVLFVYIGIFIVRCIAAFIDIRILSCAFIGVPVLFILSIHYWMIESPYWLYQCGKVRRLLFTCFLTTKINTLYLLRRKYSIFTINTTCLQSNNTVEFIINNWTANQNDSLHSSFLSSVLKFFNWKCPALSRPFKCCLKKKPRKSIKLQEQLIYFFDKKFRHKDDNREFIFCTLQTKNKDTFN